MGFLKLFKINPEFDERNDYLLAISSVIHGGDLSFILTLFHGKFAFVIDQSSILQSRFIRISAGDYPKNCRSTWYYLLNIYIRKTHIFFELSHKSRPRKGVSNG